MVRIGAYSDIHHHEYTNGVVGADVVGVESEFTNLIIDKKCDLWVFGGDRFLSRNPLDASRLYADSSLRSRTNTGIPGVVLVGNHDRWTKSQYSNHNLYVVDLHNINGVTVLDKACTHTEVLKDGTTITFHAVPAGHKVTESSLVPDPNADFNIILFHDIIKGCKFTNGIVAPEGVDAGLLDLPGFDIVLGGDNHQRQILDFKNTVGLYIGAPMQHNWGDAGSERGYLIVELEKGKKPKFEWVDSSAPRFIKEEHRIENDAELQTLLANVGGRWVNNVVRLTLTGSPEALGGLQLPKLQEKFAKATQARQVKITTKYDEQKVIVPVIDTTRVRDDGQEWRDFVNFKKPELSGLDVDRIQQMGLDYIIDADNS